MHSQEGLAKWLLAQFQHKSLNMNALYLSGMLVSCGSKNGHRKNMCLRKIGLRTQHTLTILRSIVNIFGEGGGTYMNT